MGDPTNNRVFYVGDAGPFTYSEAIAYMNDHGGQMHGDSTAASAFAQHDDWMPVVETGECAFCDNPIPMYLEGRHLTAHYQILVENGAPYLVCDDHWYRAVRGARIEDVTSHGGVHTLNVHR